MRKHLFVFGSLRRDGAQLRTLDLCRALRERYPIQFDFCVIRPGPVPLQEEVEAIGGKIHVISIRSPGVMRHFSTILRQGQYDVVESEPNLLSGLFVWLAERNRVPIRIVNLWNMLGTSNGLQRSPAWIWFMRTLIRRSATHIVAVSQSALDSVLPPAWQAASNCRVIYSGLPLDTFQRVPQCREVREEFGWPPDSQVIINVARFFEQKNHTSIVEAIRIAHAKNPRIRLLLVGDGRLKDAVASLIQRHGLGEICALAGVRTDVPRLLLASDLFFFPSLWEGLPGALLEALAAGLPVVTSDIAPMREIVHHFPSALFMAAPCDAAAHAEHILMLLERACDRLPAQEHFRQSPFTLEHTISAYSQLYGLA